MDVQTSYVYFTNIKTNAMFGIGQWLRHHVYKNSDMEPRISRLYKMLHRTNYTMRRYVWSSKAWLLKLGCTLTCRECCWQTLHRKEQLQYRVSFLSSSLLYLYCPYQQMRGWYRLERSWVPSFSPSPLLLTCTTTRCNAELLRWTCAGNPARVHSIPDTC